MSREYISPEGLRLDGRKAEELRKIQCKLGIFSRADGSAYYQQGNTKVVASVFGPREVVRKGQALHDRAIVTCEYSMATFSSGERRRKAKGDRRATEISLVMRQTLEAAIMTSLFPRSQIDIFVQILQADGGTRCAAINAATLALIDAGIPMRDFVVSAAAGYINGTPILGSFSITSTSSSYSQLTLFLKDLNYVEDSAGGPDLPVAILPKSGKVTMLQMDSKLPMDKFEEVLRLAVKGCHIIYQLLREHVKDYTVDLYDSRGSSSS
ncbi:Exosome complex component RRP41 [Balamuthia mandrillaris]